MREACGEAHMKTILATGECGTMANVYKASMVCMMAGKLCLLTSLLSTYLSIHYLPPYSLYLPPYSLLTSLFSTYLSTLYLPPYSLYLPPYSLLTSLLSTYLPTHYTYTHSVSLQVLTSSRLLLARKV